MSATYIAQSILTKRAIEGEIRELELKLRDINNDINRCESASNIFSVCSYEYRNKCNNELNGLYPQKRQLESQLNRLRNALNSINY